MNSKDLKNFSEGAKLLMHLSRDFKNFTESMKYANKMRKLGHRAYVQEFCDFDGFYWSVIVW